jgi:cytochrome c2
MRLATPILVLIALLLPLCGMAAGGDAAAGKMVFDRCKICHAIEPGQANAVGPNLHGIFGRKAGTWDDFSYSDAMKKSGIVWNDATLAKYLKDPSGFIPDNKMAFPGIKSDKDITDLLAYLHQAAQ